MKVNNLQVTKDAHRLLVEAIARYDRFSDWFNSGCNSAISGKGWFRRVYASDINTLLGPMLEDIAEAHHLLENLIESEKASGTPDVRICICGVLGCEGGEQCRWESEA